MLQDLRPKDIARLDKLINVISSRYGDGEVLRVWTTVKSTYRTPARMRTDLDKIGDTLASFIVFEVVNLYDVHFSDQQLYAEVESALGKVAREMIWMQNALATARGNLT